jgi:hypothetical protein
MILFWLVIDVSTFEIGGMRRVERAPYFRQKDGCWRFLVPKSGD